MQIRCNERSLCGGGGGVGWGEETGEGYTHKFKLVKEKVKEKGDADNKTGELKGFGRLCHKFWK